MSPSPSPPGAALRLGVIGAGRISQVAHLPAATKADRVRLVAICDSSAEVADRVAGQYSARGYTDVGRLLEDDVDAVLIATPDRSHLPLALAALGAGKHILVEKPLADTVAGAAEIAALARHLGLKLQVGAMKRHDPGIGYGRQAVAGIALTQLNLSSVGLPTLPAADADVGLADIAAAFAHERVRVWGLSATYNLIHPDEAKRGEGTTKAMALVGRAPLLGVDVVTLSSGTRDSEDMWRYHPENSLPAAWHELRATLDQLLPVAERSGVRLGIEPLSERPSRLVRSSGQLPPPNDPEGRPGCHVVARPGR